MATRGSPGTVRRADQPRDYERFSVNPEVIEAREDGMRQDPPAAGTFEWWYFEIMMRDALIVVIFMTKLPQYQQGDLKPVVSIRFRFADDPNAKGDEFQHYRTTFSASKDVCAVSSGRSSCRCVAPGKYVLQLDEDGVKGAIMMEGVVPAARIGTGHLLFERDNVEQYLGWMIPVPHGRAMIDCKVGDRLVQGLGHAYHDHNWGNRPMGEPVHHWNWGRAVVDEQGYVVNVANIVLKPTYGSVNHTDIILMKDGRFIAAGSKNASYSEGRAQPDPATGKPVADETSYVFVDGQTRYTATFHRLRTVVATALGDAAYHRFMGEFTLEISAGTATQVIHRTRHAVWELMWFGDATPLEGQELYARMLSAI